MKEVGIRDNIPVILVQASEAEAKKAALVAHMVRKNMDPDDISNVLFYIYGQYGYTNHDAVIKNLENISKHTTRVGPGPPGFREIVELMGISVYQQEFWMNWPELITIFVNVINAPPKGGLYDVQ